MMSLLSKLEGIARVRLATLPTPLEPLNNLSREMDYSGIYIKRDDLTGIGPGGNKIRSLEFIAGEAIAAGKDTLIASGPVQSNLCTLTAASCAKLGLKCILVHNGKEPEHLTGNLLLNHLLGAESYFIGETSSENRTTYVETLCENISVRCKPCVIRNGATTGRGALGYTNAILEMKQQFLEREIPGGTIFAPGGNGGVASGLIYGNALCGFPFRIVVISVEDDRERLTTNIHNTISELEDIVGLPFEYELEQACTIDDSYRGEGWGINTPQSSQVVRDFPKLEGILIENVYNSKVLVGMQDYIRSGKVCGAVCYLHTGGLGSLFAQF